MAIPALAASPHISSVVRADARSGRLVRRVVVNAPRPHSPAENAVSQAEMAVMIDSIAAEQGVEESLVHSVIRAESNYNPYAVSPKGAQGMMQLIPATARRFGVDNSFDVRANVSGGVRYLKFLLEYFKGDYARAIAAYNAGEGAVDKYKGVPPYTETRNYVVRVAKNLRADREKRSGAAARPASPNTSVVSAAPAETYNPVQTSVGSDGKVYYRTP